MTKVTLKSTPQAQRAPRYPRIGDQLDALWSLAAALEGQGIDIGDKARAMLTRIRAVKSQFPKR